MEKNLPEGQNPVEVREVEWSRQLAFYRSCDKRLMLYLLELTLHSLFSTE